MIEYHIFDVINDEAQAVRTNTLNELAPYLGSYLVKVPYELAHTPNQVLMLFDRYIEADFEGIVIRHFFAPYLRRRSTFVMKFKPKQSDVYTIVDWHEEISIKGEPKQRLGALELCDESFNTFKVGTGLSADDREALWLQRYELKGKLCEVKYQHRTERGVPRFPVFVKVLDCGSASL
jgi:ATP-dependent DNA ligase